MTSSTPSYTPEELFASTAPYYAAHRPRYAPEFYALLTSRFGLDGTQRALDLGAGPGMVARDLDQIIEPGGAVVLASGGAPSDLEPAPWRQVVDEVRTRYLGPERRAGSGTYSHPKERHQDVLARSPFSQIDTARWDHTLSRNVDDVVGWVFSLSYSSPAQLGENKHAFEQDLRETLLAFAPTGQFDEVIRTEAIIATRPQLDRAVPPASVAGLRKNAAAEGRVS